MLGVGGMRWWFDGIVVVTGDVLLFSSKGRSWSDIADDTQRRVDVEESEALILNRFMTRTASTALRSVLRGQKFCRTVCNKSTLVALCPISHLSHNASFAVGLCFGSKVSSRVMKSLAIIRYRVRCTFIQPSQWHRIYHPVKQYSNIDHEIHSVHWWFDVPVPSFHFRLEMADIHKALRICEWHGCINTDSIYLQCICDDTNNEESQRHCLVPLSHSSIVCYIPNGPNVNRCTMIFSL